MADSRRSRQHAGSSSRQKAPEATAAEDADTGRFHRADADGPPDDPLERTTVFSRPPLGRHGAQAAPGELDDTGRFCAAEPADAPSPEHTSVFRRPGAESLQESRSGDQGAAGDPLERTTLFRVLPSSGDEPDWSEQTTVHQPSAPAADERRVAQLQAALDETRGALESALEALADRDFTISKHALTQREQNERIETLAARCRELEVALEAARAEAGDLESQLAELRDRDDTATLEALQRRHAEVQTALQDLSQYVDSRRAHWLSQSAELTAERERHAELLQELEQRRREREHLRTELDRALAQVDIWRQRALEAARTPAAPGRPQRSLSIGMPDGSRSDIALTERVTTIGRASENGVQLLTPYISRQHARVVCDTDGCRIEDAGSRNGVRINGERVSVAWLRDGDRVVLGETTITYREGSV